MPNKNSCVAELPVDPHFHSLATPCLQKSTLSMKAYLSVTDSAFCLHFQCQQLSEVRLGFVRPLDSGPTAGNKKFSFLGKAKTCRTSTRTAVKSAQAAHSHTPAVATSSTPGSCTTTACIRGFFIQPLWLWPNDRPPSPELTSEHRCSASQQPKEFRHDMRGLTHLDDA